MPRHAGVVHSGGEPAFLLPRLQRPVPTACHTPIAKGTGVARPRSPHPPAPRQAEGAHRPRDRAAEAAPQQTVGEDTTLPLRGCPMPTAPPPQRRAAGAAAGPATVRRGLRPLGWDSDR